jgi:hypothetical protein
MEKLRFGDEYLSNKSKSYPFPSEDIPQSRKADPGYYLAACNAIVSKFVNNKCAIPYNIEKGTRSFSELRAYRNGNNNPNKYKDFVAGLPDKKTGHRKSSLNISWEVLKILSQKMDVVKGYLQKIRYDVQTDAIDYQALINKKTMVALAKLHADPRMAGMMNAVNQAAGRPALQQPDTSEMPGGMSFADPNEVDVAASVGAFYIEQEAALQNLLLKTQYESRLDSIADLWDEDLFTLGIAASFVTTNGNTSMVTADYVDPDTAIWPYSKYADYRDITWAGHIRRMTIGQLRRETDVDEQKLIEIARKYSSDGYGHLPNGFYSSATDWKNNNGFGMNMLDQIEVDVVDCRWYGKKNVNVTSIFRDKEKRSAVNTVDDAYELSDRDKKRGKELYKYSNQTIYKAKMVLGTSMVFDYGEDSDLSYKKDINGNMWPVFPYRFSRCLSLVERCIGFVDDANLANLKLRIARTKMPAPPNMVIDKAFLENVAIDGVKMKPMQLMQLLQDEGFLVGDSKNQWGQANGVGKPISPIPTDIINVLAAWKEDMAFSISMIEKVTGINDIFSAQTPQRQTGLGVSNLMVQGTQNALTPIVKARESLTETTMQVAGKKWQVVATYMPDEQRKRLSINRSLDIVKVGSDLLDYDFDIRIEVGYNDEEKQQLLADITNMRNAARQGAQTGMNENDFLVVQGMIRQGNIRQAQLYTAQAVERRRKQALQEQQMNIQANGEQQRASAQQAAQNEQQTIQLEGQVSSQGRMQEIQAKLQADLILQQRKAQDDANKLAIENIYGNKKSA